MRLGGGARCVAALAQRGLAFGELREIIHVGAPLLGRLVSGGLVVAFEAVATWSARARDGCPEAA
jgi:hypothetical protein